MNSGTRAENTPPECALAAEMFDQLCVAGTMKQILALHREICATLHLQPTRLPDFYPKLKEKLVGSWKAQALFKKFDARANHKVYAKGRACEQTRVLIIGAGPCGLRAAIECQLLGAKVVVVEKRDRMSRNNVLHLWPYVIQDLRALGAKKFFGKFCAGSIDHISIRQLQCILLKVCLLLGVEFHEGVGFEELLEPTVTENGERLGWRARVSPEDHPVRFYEFDTLLGADGKRNTLPGFRRKEFRGKLAMAITANFINRHTEMEASVPEISGVAFIFNQKFFKDLKAKTGIDLENIVYYKDDTHYFVMTAKKHSLLEKGVLHNDYAEVSRLLDVSNVDRAALMRYAQEAARFSTNGCLPLTDFALNHYGEPDVALFDFTSMYAAENASMVYERSGKRLLCQLVGDSLLEPFWPTGSGCARGFLSALDAAWAVRAWGQQPSPHPLSVLSLRESIYRLLAQTTPENLNRDFGGYTLDPGTRYPNLNRSAVSPHRVIGFYDTDESMPIDTSTGRKRRRDAEMSEGVLTAWLGASAEEGGLRGAVAGGALASLVRRYRPNVLPPDADLCTVLHDEFGIPKPSMSLQELPEAKLRAYLSRVYNVFKGDVPHVPRQSNIFMQLKQSQQKEKQIRNTVDHSVSAYSNAVAEMDKSHSSYKKKRRGTRAPQEEGRVVTGGGRSQSGGARVARLAAELAGPSEPGPSLRSSKPKDLMRSVGKIERDDWNLKEIERKITENRLGRPEPRAAERVPKWDREQFLGRQRRLKEGENDGKWGAIDETLHKLDQKLRDSGRPDHGTKKVANLANKFVNKETAPVKSEPKEDKRSWRGPATTGMQCAACGTRVFAAEGVTADGLHLHRACFRCAVCRAALRPGNYAMERCGIRLVCLRHSGAARSVAASTPERISLEVSDSGAREIDEDEWTDRNCLASETSNAGLSDEEESSSEEYGDADAVDVSPAATAPEPAAPAHDHPYQSDDSFGYDDYSDDGGDSSGAESCSRMRAAREARRREVPAHVPPPADSSEVESEEETDSSDKDESCATEVSTDSEFAREEPAPPPAILVTEAAAPQASPPTSPPPTPRRASPPAPCFAPPRSPTASPRPARPRSPPTGEYALSRTRSAGGLTSQRALELKRKYLLGEPTTPTVRKSDSASQLDSKVEAFRYNITAFQKMLCPAPLTEVSKPVLTYPSATNFAGQMKHLSKREDTFKWIKCDMFDHDLDSDSLSEKQNESQANTVPRVEVRDEVGDLVQLDSLMNVSNANNEEDEQEEPSHTPIPFVRPPAVAASSDSSDSCRDITTLAMTETEPLDWATESAVLDDSGVDGKENRSINRTPRILSGPKSVLDDNNSSGIASHVCGRSSPKEAIVYSNASDHFQFADEGEQDPPLQPPVTAKNMGYMELVDDEYNNYSLGNDRSMNYIELKTVEPQILPQFSFSDLPTPNSVRDVSTTSMDLDLDSNLEDTIKTDVKISRGGNNEFLASPNYVDVEVTSTLTPLTCESHPYTTDIELDNSAPEMNKSRISGTTNIELDKTTHEINKLRISASSADSESIVSEHPIVPELRSQMEHRFNQSAEQSNAIDAYNNNKNAKSVNSSESCDYCRGCSSVSPGACCCAARERVAQVERERREQMELVQRLVMTRHGAGAPRSRRRARVPPPVPPPPAPPTVAPPVAVPPTAAPPTAAPLPPSRSDPALAERRPLSVITSLSNQWWHGLKNKWVSEPDLMPQVSGRGGVSERAPPVPPPPTAYSPEPPQPSVSVYSAEPPPIPSPPPPSYNQHAEEAAWVHARWTALTRNEPAARRVAALERRLARPLSAEQQAAVVAELVQVSAQRDAHKALLAADRRRCAASGAGGD